jgi:hypothetical protein
MGDVVSLIERKDLPADCLLVKGTEHMCEVRLHHTLFPSRASRFMHDALPCISELAIAANALMNHAG